MIDQGNPAPPLRALDNAGNPRAVGGTCVSSSLRRDIGAFELVPNCRNFFAPTTIQPPPSSAKKKCKKPKHRAAAAKKKCKKKKR
jgi:hypothetical protein